MTKTMFKPPGTASARTDKRLLKTFDDLAAIAGKENGRTGAISEQENGRSAADLMDSG